MGRKKRAWARAGRVLGELAAGIRLPSTIAPSIYKKSPSGLQRPKGGKDSGWRRERIISGGIGR